MKISAMQNKTADVYNSTAGRTATEELIDKIDGKKNKGKSETTDTINANELNLPDDSGRSIKELFAHKAALKVQIDQFEKDNDIDGDIKDHLDKKAELAEEAGFNQSQVKRLESLKEDLRETYGVEEDSTEQKDLKIMEKQTLRQELTDEELDRLLRMGPMTDYQKAALEYTKMEAEFTKRASNAVDASFNEDRAVTAIKLGRLKVHPMIDAKKEAEDLLEKVDGEIQKSLIEEIKNRVNENLDIDPNTSILDNPQTLIDQKKATDEDLKGLAVDEKV